MRRVINLSLPPRLADEAKRRAKKYGFTTTSEYMRFLLSLDEDLISQTELLAMALRADREYRGGKMKKYSSLKELL